MSVEHNAPNQNQPNEIITPMAQAAVNAMIASSVREAVASVFASLSPVLKDMALTPEKLTAALTAVNTHIETPAEVASRLREERESQKSRDDEAENRKQLAARRAACSHRDKNGKTAICITHNFPDHQPRGVCPLCGDWVHPREWRIAATVEEAAKYHTHQGKAYICEAHKDYPTVASLESFS